MHTKNIIWLVSYPKSGNTWFRIFLSNLLSKQDLPVDINDLEISPISSSRHLFDQQTGVSSSDLTIDEITELRPEVYRQLSRESDKVIYQKVHDAFFYTPSGKEVFPGDITKGVIYIIRNPLDIVVSFSHHTGKSISETVKIINSEEYAMCKKKDRLFNQLEQPLSNWSGHVSSWVDESKLPVHIIRYEDMLMNPEVTFRKATQFIGIDIDDNEIDKAIRASDHKLLVQMEERNGFREKPQGMRSFFRYGKSDNWQSVLSKDEIDDIINKHFQMMKRYGYSEVIKPNSL